VNGGNVLIIGPTGQLGSRIVRRFAALGEKPRVLVRTRENADKLAPIAKAYVGDLLRPHTLALAFQDAERVFVLGQPTPDMEALERNAIDAAVAAGIKRIVYLSNFTARVGSDLPPNHTHAVHEQLVSTLGVEWTVLGPTRYMTNFPFDWASVLNDGVLQEMGGAGIMTCIDPEDVAEVAVKLLNEDGHNGKTYRLTSEDAFTADELASVLSKVLERSVRVVDGAPTPGYFSMVAEGRYYRTDTATELLGRSPRPYTDWLAESLPTLVSRFARR
jgi:uncharacterized protein YbjT (DUF2867 family)